MDNNLYVQYGCGWNAPEDWINYDASPTLRIEKIPLVGQFLSARYKGNPAPFPRNVQYGDIIKGLPLSDKSCAALYCSHILEHLCLDDFRIALRNTHRLLKPNGLFRLVVPDLAYYVQRYAEVADSPESALAFNTNSGLGELRRPRGPLAQIKYLMGNSRHRWMWDFPSMERELYQAGFTNVRRAKYGDSADPKFSAVEQYERWENCLGIECKI